MPSVQELFGLPPVDEMVVDVVRLVVAALAGALLGAERESVGKAAGLRTHMLVSVASALFVSVATDEGGESVARVIQGVAAGIGFIGAGTILKHASEARVTGLTTAASVWMTSAAGAAAGAGAIWLAVVATVIAWLVLNVLARVESRFPSNGH